MPETIAKPVVETPAAVAENTPAIPASDNTETQNQNTATSEVGLTPEAIKIRTVLEIVKRDPSAAEDPEIKAILDFVNKKVTPQTGNNNDKQQQPENIDPQERGATEEKPAIDETTDKTTDVVEEPAEVNEKSIFFKQPKNNKSYTIKDNNDIFEALKGFGIEAKELNDLGTLFSSAKKWRADSNELSETNKKLNSFNEVFEKAPVEILDQMDAWIKGADWRAVAAKAYSKIDYSKDFNSLDKADMIKHYVPEVTIDEYAEFDTDPLLKGALSLAKKAFEIEKKDYDRQRAEYLTGAEKQRTLLKESADRSVASLSQSFPAMDKSAIKKVASILNSGDINSFFFNKDGSLMIDAAEKLALAIYGKQEIENSVKTAVTQTTKKVESKVREEIVSKSSDNPNVRKVHQRVDETPEAAKSIIRMMEKNVSPYDTQRK